MLYFITIQTRYEINAITWVRICQSFCSLSGYWILQHKCHHFCYPISHHRHVCHNILNVISHKNLIARKMCRYHHNKFKNVHSFYKNWRFKKKLHGSCMQVATRKVQRVWALGRCSQGLKLGSWVQVTWAQRSRSLGKFLCPLAPSLRLVTWAWAWAQAPGTSLPTLSNARPTSSLIIVPAHQYKNPLSSINQINAAPPRVAWLAKIVEFPYKTHKWVKVWDLLASKQNKTFKLSDSIIMWN